ncbi:MAG TPA: hypothetical protein VJU61_18945 [Polyangiaceae bacterium]|nr:hypothetical protein [Polyangiaceae bacterium]
MSTNVRRVHDREHDALVLAVMLAGQFACRQVDLAGTEFRSESSRLQNLTSPANTELITRETPARTSMLVTQEWRIVTTLAWPEYVNLVTSTLQLSYACTAVTAERLSCSRSSPGDRMQLELSSQPDAGGLSVLARFTARPD